jgi:hypothetical protein
MSPVSTATSGRGSREKPGSTPRVRLGPNFDGRYEARFRVRSEYPPYNVPVVAQYHTELKQLLRVPELTAHVPLALCW